MGQVGFGMLCGVALRRAAMLLAITGLSMGCQTAETPPSSPPVAADRTLDADRQVGEQVEGLDEAAQHENTRLVRRLRVDSLQAAITVVAGKDDKGQPIVWRFEQGSQSQVALDDDALGITLGRPDYMERLEENPVAGLLYTKFMGDMARQVCAQMTLADSKRGDGATHTLWRFAPVHVPATEAQIAQNLQYLILRFLGYKLPAEHEMSVSFRNIYDVAAASTGLASTAKQSQIEGWHAVCIGLFESPLFHLQ